LASVVYHPTDSPAQQLQSQRFTFRPLATYFSCWQPYFICKDMHPPCSEMREMLRCLMRATVSAAWWLRDFSPICLAVLQDAGAPMSSTDEYRKWLMDYVDDNADQYQWVSNAALVTMNLWQGLYSMAESDTPILRSAKRPRHSL
jgi:hypothetical protein